MIEILFALFAQIFAIYGGFYLKKGATNNIYNKKSLLGLLLYGFSVIPWLIALRYGELSTIYPFAALTYIGTTTLGVKHLNEKINKRKIIALTLIVLGVIIIGLNK